jgi:trehalose 6-phosphate synthase/phosphatase
MRQRVMSYDAQAWARQFMDELRGRPPEPSPPPITEARSRLHEAFVSGRRIALILDYDGTLREIVHDPAAARPTDELRRLLALLAGLKTLDVTLISGRTQRDLEAFVGDTPFGLIAEHGAAIRRPGTARWQELDGSADYGWKKQISRLLDLYTTSTPGSFVEEKRTGLVWHYRKSDPEFGRFKATELTEELAALVANDPVQIRHGRKIVEVASAHVTKGRAVAALLAERPADLVLIAGDDVTDESMFALDLPSAITIKVGDADTRARYRVADPHELRRLLIDVFSTRAQDLQPSAGSQGGTYGPIAGEAEEEPAAGRAH